MEVHKQFPFLSDCFVQKTLGNLGKEVSLLSVEPIGAETGLASVLAKIEIAADGKVHFFVVKSFASLSLPSEGENEKVDMILRELRFYTDLSQLLSPQYIKIPALRGSIIEQATNGNSQTLQTYERIILDYVSPPWRLGDQIKGLSFEEIKAGVKSLALLHSFPIQSLNPKPKWLSEPFNVEENGFLHSMTPFLQSTIFKVLPFLSGTILTKEEDEKMRENITTVIPNIPVGETIATLEGLWKYWKKIIPAMKNAPIRLVHMDARGENMFFKENETGECDVMWVDWQNVSLAPEGMDISYLLCGSLTIENRRKYEDELIQLYVEEFNKQENNEEIELEEVKRRYQISLLWPVLWASCTLSGLEELLDSCNKTEPIARERARQFMTKGSQRYLQAAIDHSSVSLIESSLLEQTTK